MKALILNGARKGDPSLLALIQHLLEEKLGEGGWGVTVFLLRELSAAHCAGCSGCWAKDACVYRDSTQEIAGQIADSDLLIFLTPITFGGYSTELKQALARLIPGWISSSAELDGDGVREPHYPSLLAVGTLQHRVADSERFFREVVERSAVNFFSPRHAAGVIVGDPGPEQIRQEILALLDQVGVAS
ncbi:MAG: flavodoxin family protein [Anaerolineae bacterium]|jgi:hypothetical protein|nr:flavodoxin family protein [Anaerolineae bacterium]